jgi:SAM-dependent methyltransferase
MPPIEPNQYSPQWFDFFHSGIPSERTLRETDFLVRHLPLPAFRRVADVCCGMGRHARALSGRGYSVTGVERDATAIDHARTLAGGPQYECADVRRWAPSPASFDAVTVLSQSFGYFDPEANLSVLRQLAAGLRPNGRLVLDLWNPDFFIARQGEREFTLPRGIVRETKRVQSGRLHVRLDYPDGSGDLFSWQLFSPEELPVFAAAAGLTPVHAGSAFTGAAPSGTVPGWQCVLEKDGPGGHNLILEDPFAGTPADLPPSLPG